MSDTGKIWVKLRVIFDQDKNNIEVENAMNAIADSICLANWGKPDPNLQMRLQNAREVVKKYKKIKIFK